MNLELGLWRILTRGVVFLLFLAGLLFVAQWYYPLIQRNERMRKEILRLDGQIQKEEANTKQLRASMDALAHDPKTVERLARETLGYAKPGETVIRFEEPPPGGPAAR